MKVVELYVDGSYRRTEPDTTYGGAIIVIEGKPVACQRYITKKPDFVSSWNVGGELAAAIFGLAVAAGFVEGEPAKIVINYDYQGIEQLVQGTPRWRAKTPCTAQYVGVISMFRDKYPNVELEYHKVKAHSGDKWNEMADRVANGVFSEELTAVRMRDHVY